MDTRSQARNEFFDEFLRLSLDAIQEAASELAEPARAELAERIALGFIALWGGANIYIPRDLRRIRAARDREICACYDGSTRELLRLAKKFGITTNTVFGIVRAENQRRKKAIP
jgi:Mor family transcriptional regulator